ncbi:MAG: hypothetical protein ACRDRA_21185 [Pseudonocardiaceae bacterium]
MIESGNVVSELPELDRTGDPQGGAVTWALLAVGMVLVASIILTAMWVARGW